MVRRVKKRLKKKVFPMKFPLNPFAGTPESLEKVINRLPNKFKEQSAQEFDKIYTKIPDEFKVTIGSTLYEFTCNLGVAFSIWKKGLSAR